MVASKLSVAATSAIAAVALLALKLAVGLSTGSLGVLAEAAHSGLDLAAACLTVIAVRVADREADESHPYGHGRFENLSALASTALLMVTCVWIAYEAVGRLVGGGHHVDASGWAFAVMALSIGVDWWRSRALHAAAEHHESQALAADALHFSSDMWSSAVVIVGLGLVWLGDLLGGVPALAAADAVAALGVSVFVVIIGVRLGKATVEALSDTAPPGLAPRIAAAAAEIDDVLVADRVRLRRVGNRLFVDLRVAVPRTTNFARAHSLADEVEDRVRGILPSSDVVVHVEPEASPTESPADRVHFVARQRGVRVHDVRLRKVGARLEVDLHVELDPKLTLADAHELASGLEADILATDPRFGAVNTHIEAPLEAVTPDVEITAVAPDLVGRVRDVADRLTGPGATHDVRVYRSAAGLNLVLHASLQPDLGIDQVHRLSAEVEQALRDEVPGVSRVLVHAEPSDST